MTADHSSHHRPASHDRPDKASSGDGFRSRLQALWHALVGAVGLIMGLLPHVLHHIGLLAGTADQDALARAVRSSGYALAGAN